MAIFRDSVPALTLDAQDLQAHGSLRHYPESTEGDGRVSVLKRQEGAPVHLG